MSDLQNQTPANTYKGLLQVGDYTDGVDGTSKYVSDGEGTPSALSLSTTKVGVGTASPSQELEVNGNIVATTLTTSGVATVGSVSTSGQVGAGSVDVSGNVVADEYALDQTGTSSSAVAIHAPTTNELAIRTNSTEAMRIDSDGNVGVAVTDPNARLEVKTRDSDELAIRVMSENENSLLDIRKSDNGDTEFLNTYYSASEGGLSGGFAFKTTDNASGAAKRTRMSILQNGNVGVGVTNPSSAFEVQCNTDEAILKGISPNGLSNVFIKKTNTGDTEFSNAFVSGGTTGDFSFTNGKVGIGTVSPSAPLEVDSTTGGVIIPRISNSQRNLISSPTDGEMIYNTTTNRFQGRANGAWVDLH